MTFTLNTATPVARVDERFLSFTLDGHTFDGGDTMPFWAPDSRLTRVLAGALAPAYLRFGGNSHSTLLYNVTDGPMTPLPPLTPPEYQPPAPKTLMSKAQWMRILAFGDSANISILFALNDLLRRDGPSGASVWDSTAASELINATRSHPSVSWELANEPDLFHYAFNISDHSIFPVSPEQLVEDHERLRELLGPRGFVAGPDVANSGYSGGRRYWREFWGNVSRSGRRLHSSGRETSPLLNAATWHHYYGNGKTATTADTHSARVLDSFITSQQAMATALRDASAEAHDAAPPIWLGETSSFYGGGAVNISDRFGAGFTWLDKLGAAARLNVSVVCRQAWMGGSYSLIHYTSFVPLPDYWASVLHKRLLGVDVIDVEGSLDPGREV